MVLADPRLARFPLAEGEAPPPKSPGGLDIEGMTAMADGQPVLIGFRSPVLECKRLKDPARKRFRGVWVRLPEET